MRVFPLVRDEGPWGRKDHCDEATSNTTTEVETVIKPAESVLPTEVAIQVSANSGFSAVGP